MNTKDKMVTDETGTTTAAIDRNNNGTFNISKVKHYNPYYYYYF